jgi:hypothetical protein
MSNVAALSVCLVTRGPASRVRALLELVRPVASEVVLAVDERGDRATAAACDDLADRTYLLEAASPERVMGWLMGQCRGDWILRLDDDEVPSAALLNALPRLVEESRPTNMPMPRRWLYPDRGRYIADHPWRPDYQIRLMRNVPGVWLIRGLRHDNIDILGERRLVDLPLYHLDLLINSYGSRRSKRERYEADRPGYSNQGFPVNLMYTPEDLGDVETDAVPGEDQVLIDSIFERVDPAEQEAASPTWKRVSAREAERFFPRRRLSPDAYRARLRVVRPPLSLPAGSVRLVEIEVENLGDEWWPAAEAEPEIRAAYRWLDPSGAKHAEGPRSLFTETVAPGQTTRLMLVVETPARAGAYVLEADIVHERVRWFGQPTRFRLEITPPTGAPRRGGRALHGLRRARRLARRLRWAARKAGSLRARF